MFRRSAAFYDAIYAERGKDYVAEAAWVRAAVERELPDAAKLLDVACGTGIHLAELRRHFTVEGLDADPAMIEIARTRLPGVPLTVARMQDFSLPDRFDVAVSFFSAIGYVRDEAELRSTIANVARHLRERGIFVVEPWLTPADWREGMVDAVYVDRFDLKIARMGVSERYGNTSVLRYEYLVAEPSGISHFSETHRMQLFSDEQYREAFAASGFRVRNERSDNFPHGLYVATKNGS